MDSWYINVYQTIMSRAKQLVCFTIFTDEVTENK